MTAAAPLVHLDGRPPERKRLPVADAFRALASFSVVFGHMLFFSTLRLQDHLALTRLFEAFGLCGVMCFFVLSGFLVGRPFIDGLLEPLVALPAWRGYALRRFARIYPLYALAVVVSACGPWLHGHAFPWRFLLAHLTFAHGFFVDEIAGTINGPLWTMAVDAQFYVLLPIGCAALARLVRRRAPHARVGPIAVALGALALSGLLERAVVFVWVPGAVSDFDRATVFARNAIGLGGAFALGLGLALVVRTARPPSVLVARAAIAAGIVLGMSLMWTGIESHGTALQETLRDPIAALAVALAMYGASRRSFARYTGRVTSPIGVTPVAPRSRRSPLGRLAVGVAFVSYPFYLFHWPVLFVWFDVVLHRLLLAPNTALCAAVLVFGGLTCSVLVAVAAALCVESAQRALVRKRRSAPVWRSSLRRA